MLNLIEDPWIPCVLDGGERRRFAPWEIFGYGKKIDFSSLAGTRPDFQGSIIQFLIGLVQTTMAPRDESEWLDALEEPPEPSYVRERFASVSHAFNLGGNGPRFMQDPSCANGDEQPIESLVIGMPGENTLKLNRDFFLKRGTIQSLCPACAALALHSLQVNGPQGGKGHMTGLRGGGPLTTIILGHSLAETVWLNVLPAEDFFMGLKSDRKTEIQDIFPWMGPIRTSEGNNRGRMTGISNASQLQMFWGMGRRILLETGKTHVAVCDICGERTESGIGKFRTKPYGIQYDESWRHILTPYYRKGETMLPVHLTPEGITYRHWLGIVQNDASEGREIARVVERFKRIQPISWGILEKNPRLWAFGYDFDKVKARCWYDSTMPLISVRDDIRETYETHTAQIVRAAQYVNEILHRAVKEALYSPDSVEQKVMVSTQSRETSKNIPVVRARFWAETEALFYSTLERLKLALEAGGPVESEKITWLREVRKIAFRLFDFYAQFNYIDENRPAAIVKARKRLSMTVSPGAPKIAKILQIPNEKRT